MLLELDICLDELIGNKCDRLIILPKVTVSFLGTLVDHCLMCGSE